MRAGLRGAWLVWVFVVLSAAGLRLEVATAEDHCDQACCCASEGPSCCATDEATVRITAACGCGHDAGHLHLDFTDLVSDLGPAGAAWVDAGRPTLEPSGVRLTVRWPRPAVPPPRAAS